VALLVAAAHARRSGASAPLSPYTGEERKKERKKERGIRINRIR